MSDHSQHVDAWMKTAADGTSAEHLLDLFELAMRALWNRAHLTLGDVTLTAVMDRVLVNAGDEFPAFASLRIDRGGVDCRGLRSADPAIDERALREGIRFVVLEFLVVIGSLTGEILSPPLHSELSKIGRKEEQS